jgi:hypothetical protein
LIYLFLTRCCFEGKDLGLKKCFFFWKLVEVVFEDNGGRETDRLTGGDREELHVSGELWD